MTRENLVCPVCQKQRIQFCDNPQHFGCDCGVLEKIDEVWHFVEKDDPIFENAWIRVPAPSLDESKNSE